MSDFDHTIPTENDNSNQVDEQPAAHDVVCTDVSSNTHRAEDIHEDSNEYWRDDGSIYDVKNVQLPEDTPVKKEWGSYAPENAGDFLPRDGEEPNFVLIDENSNVPAPRSRFARGDYEAMLSTLQMAHLKGHMVSTQLPKMEFITAQAIHIKMNMQDKMEVPKHREHTLMPQTLTAEILRHRGILSMLQRGSLLSRL